MQLERGERVCLVGRNGSGKSTLLKVVSGDITPDEGEIRFPPSAHVARLTQEVPLGTSGPVFQVIAEGLGDTAPLLAKYHQISQALASDPSEERLAELERVQHQLEASGGWDARNKVETVISRLGLPAEAEFSALSGGLKRRVLLGQALVREPDLLLLDEPTNHLDIEAIRWLEEFLLSYGGTLLFITHDRMFLQKLATRIVELDRGQLSSWPGDYNTYLQRKEAQLEAEANQQALFDKKLAQEEAWIRQGIKARRTRNEGRVRALKAMREERRQRRELTGKANIQLQDADRSGKLVCEAIDISHSYDGRPLIKDFSTTIMRGDKIGIVGPNGAGKTTLLNILLGRLTPEQGSVRLGTKLEIAYFDQMRGALQENATVADNVGEGSEKVVVNGKPKHIMGYLQDFLFPPERARTPVKALSGGERNRLLLAKLFTQPANVLVMDEPTNDLDIETLDLLEELLIDYAGTLLIVSHDRTFLNNVVTSTLAFEGEGRVNEYVGGYDDWLRQKPVAAAPKPSKKGPAPTTEKPKPVTERKAKLGYKEQRELDALPQQIETLEAELSDLHQLLADDKLYREGTEAITSAQARLAETEQALEDAYARWEALEARRN
ncbi:ABC transporter ATP-binding protein [Alkalilimnicola ehrlichii]|uniref:ATP-binding protein Uup n=2 Tax=Alkalilimnicola ehrlichii TaxID=351052 RepID=A0A3E0WJV4_9GAMM|nr:ABC transporter ATP-binding protein [Alkalilimnicola ehrlichii]RFA32367.1 ABC transporter ATP-binding protein [Alkalilimnicola ehrlichii]